MGKIEQKINGVLQHFPGIKKGVKRVYQLGVYAISPKLKSEGDITCITPKDEYEYFFGYYDKSPWDATGRYILCNRVKNAYAKPDNDDEAQLVLIDTQDNNRVSVIGTAHAWNVQQGCMLQWLGPDYCEKVIYNDFQDGVFCAVILNVWTGKNKILSMPVYAVAADGGFALTLDFTRLHRLRPGYGYCNVSEATAKEKCPNSPCIWRMDLTTGQYLPLFFYRDFVKFEVRPEMSNAEHKVNHLMISPDGDRFMVLHPSYGPDGRVVTDTYPDRHRVARIYILDEKKEETPVVAKVFAHFRYDNDVRCDLRPRWNRDGTRVCFDSVFEGKRGLYVVNMKKRGCIVHE